MLNIAHYRLKFWTYFVTSILVAVVYGWINDKSLDYILAAPYWTAFTLIAVRWLMGERASR